MTTNSSLILASTSIFRKQLLEKLGLAFTTDSPDIDETAKPGESPKGLVKRLSYEKAKCIADKFDSGLVIGSDQVACVNDTIMGKPGNFDNALKQLRSASGKAVYFFTGLTLFNAATKSSETICEVYKVHFRTLNDEQIRRYLEKEQPYNCAGSFKSEGYGISLFEKLEGDDPNALIGLPLIRLIQMLEKEGILIP